MSRHPYGSPGYTAALGSRTGDRVVDLPEWGCCLSVRSIAQGREDAAGPYPLAPIIGAARLKEGIERLREERFVSVVLVPDPLSGPTREMFQDTFSVCKPFKRHLIVDRFKEKYQPTTYHARRIKRGLNRCEISIIPLAECLPDWLRLYDNLRKRHDISGVTEFSNEYFSYISTMPDIITFAARIDSAIVGMSIWLYYNDAAYNHLNAFDDIGYLNSASFALFDTAIRTFTSARCINLGGAAGLSDDSTDGLYKFKAGFANSSTQSILCGEILDYTAYGALTAEPRTDFFPAYRRPL